MNGAEKAQLAEFLDKASAALGAGYAAPREYHFEDDAGAGVGAAAERSAPSVLPAQNNDSLQIIAAEVDACSLCRLCKTRQHTVSGEGCQAPLVLVVGEGPGADEDASGRPFVGRAGALLDKMLLSVGLSREKNCYIANVVKCRPPGNRTPEGDEVSACLPYLDRQINLLRPQIIFGLGNTPAGALLNAGGITKLRGNWNSYRGIPYLPSFHPSYLLRDESQKVPAWEDLKTLCLRLAKIDSVYAAETAELRAARKIL
jgi:DNA polymerase